MRGVSESRRHARTALALGGPRPAAGAQIHPARAALSRVRPVRPLRSPLGLRPSRLAELAGFEPGSSRVSREGPMRRASESTKNQAAAAAAAAAAASVPGSIRSRTRLALDSDPEAAAVR